MNNVLDTSTERGHLTLDEAEDAILARWEDPDEKASDDETEAAPDTEEETTGALEFDEEDYDEVDLEDEIDPEEDEAPVLPRFFRSFPAGERNFPFMPFSSFIASRNAYA